MVTVTQSDYTGCPKLAKIVLNLPRVRDLVFVHIIYMS